MLFYDKDIFIEMCTEGPYGKLWVKGIHIYKTPVCN